MLELVLIALLPKAEGGFGATEGLAQGRNPALLCSLEWRWEAELAAAEAATDSGGDERGRGARGGASLAPHPSASHAQYAAMA